MKTERKTLINRSKLCYCYVYCILFVIKCCGLLFKYAWFAQIATENRKAQNFTSTFIWTYQKFFFILCQELKSVPIVLKLHKIFLFCGKLRFMGGGRNRRCSNFQEISSIFTSKTKKRWINGSFLHVQFELRFFIQWFVQHSCFPSKLSLLVVDVVYIVRCRSQSSGCSDPSRRRGRRRKQSRRGLRKVACETQARERLLGRPTRPANCANISAVISCRLGIDCQYHLFRF